MLGYTMSLGGLWFRVLNNVGEGGGYMISLGGLEFRIMMCLGGFMI